MCKDRMRGFAGALALLLTMLLSAGLSPLEARAQSSDASFEIDAINARSEAPERLTRLDLYVRVPYTNLHFLRAGDGFSARYEMTAEAYRLVDGEREQLADRQRWEREVELDEFSQTRASDRFDASAQSMELAPGEYLLVVRLDNEAMDEVLVEEQRIEVRPLGGPVAVSDLILLEDFDTATNSITPRVSSRIDTEEGALSLFYEVYAEQAREVRIAHEVIRTRRDRGLPVIGALLGRGEEESGEVAYEQERAAQLEAGRTPRVVTLPFQEIQVGEYLVRTRIEDLRGQQLAQVEKHITVRWRGLRAHIRDLGEAIAQLHYIAKESELRHIQDAPTEGEQMRRFEAFWDKRDPTPGTERNERMEEYYYRVARANDSYGGESDGWSTDRGHVLVLFGEPDRVDRHSDNAKPYEVWHYNRIDRRFIFVDRGGSYKLLEPIWDEHSRIR